MKITKFENYGTIMEHWLTVVCTEWDANKSCIIIWSWEKDEKNAVWFLFLHTIMFYNDYSTSFRIREYSCAAQDELFDNTYQFEKCNNKSKRQSKYVLEHQGKFDWCLISDDNIWMIISDTF